jgi:hypothetical protein
VVRRVAVLATVRTWVSLRTLQEQTIIGSPLAQIPMSASPRWSQPVEATLYLKGKRWSVTMDQGFRRGFTAQCPPVFREPSCSGSARASKGRPVKTWTSVLGGDAHRLVVTRRSKKGQFSPRLVRAPRVAFRKSPTPPPHGGCYGPLPKQGSVG